ncbi:MAG TPA: HAMP domain-containing sensor histidine kinase [Candidatus Eisenbacteria bacterium]|nr:HAMP domain-containing sensor histidine kinase [Candidatus Eisenbacteria bacterium]
MGATLRSLRLRLILLTAFVAVSGLTAAALLSREGVRTEYKRLVSSENAARVGDAASVLEAWLRQTGSFAAADSVLARLSGPASGGLLLIAPDGSVLAASSPEMRTARIQREPNGALSITSQVREGRVVSIRREMLVGGPRANIRGPDGALRATLYRLPPRLPGESPGSLRSPGSGDIPFIASVNRWLVLAAAVSGMLAILLALMLSRRILGPVEALTAAVRKMESGDLGQRVPVRSSDEIAELTRAFNGMAESLEANEASRKRLLGDVAHELRAPLTNLRCQIEAVRDGLATPDDSAMRSLHEETLLLGRLVDDIRDLALAEAGRLPLHPERVHISTVVDVALAAVAPLAQERRVALRSSAADSPDVHADPARLAQILRNLLSNAIAATPPGGSIEVRGGAEDGMAWIAVKDTGRGIGAEHLPRVFDRFYRADPDRARETGGAGLGLSIVKQLVEAQGGRVFVESEIGRGSTFRFTLPRFS